MRPIFVAATAALLLAGCATVSSRPQAAGHSPVVAPPAEALRDPFEPVNRALFRLGRGLDRLVARPIATSYRRILPRPVRHGLHNALQNADEPGVALNDLLQGRIGVGVRTAIRFAANTTFGLAGLFDPAARAGLPHHENGFAATLDRYGVAPGPYLYVPLLGPSSVRDAVGGGLDYVSDPVALVRFHHAPTVNMARTGLSVVDTRALADHEIEALFATATDPYATLRSVYLQYQASKAGEAQPPLEELPDFPDAPPAGAGAPPQ